MIAPCPACSNIGAIVQPCWLMAQMTTARVGRPHFTWASMSCRHAATMAGATVEAYERPLVERRWNAEAERLFTERTARWTPEERARFRRLIGMDRSATGEAAELPLAPSVPPADPSTHFDSQPAGGQLPPS